MRVKKPYKIVYAIKLPEVDLADFGKPFGTDECSQDHIVAFAADATAYEIYPEYIHSKAAEMARTGQEAFNV